MKKISNKNYRKFVAKIDRHFTWERKSLTEGGLTIFWGEAHYIVVGQSGIFGVWVKFCDRRTGNNISKFLKTPSELNQAIKLVKVFG